MRRIIRKSDVLNQRFEISEEFSEEAVRKDKYFEKIAKLIPGEIIAAFLAINNLIEANDSDFRFLHWVSVVILFLITPLYIRKVTASNLGLLKSQIWVSTVAFAIWVFAIGGPFLYLGWYNKMYGAILIILFSVTSPLFIPEERN